MGVTDQSDTIWDKPRYVTSIWKMGVTDQSETNPGTLLVYIWKMGVTDQSDTIWDKPRYVTSIYLKDGYHWSI